MFYLIILYKVRKICCQDFKPTETMFTKFTSDMYDSQMKTSDSVDPVTGFDEVMDIFESEDAQEIHLYE